MASHNTQKLVMVTTGAAALCVLTVTLLLLRGLTGGSSDRQRVVVTSQTESGSLSAESYRFSFLDQPRDLPEIHFTDGEGRALSLEDFRNRPIILNIWATWCIPCRQEMPALDRLQAQIGASQLLVLPLSIDRQGAPVVQKFYQELGLASLRIYIDKSGKASGDLNTVGLPTTLLVDRDGREIGRKIGPAEWDSPEVIALLRERFGLPASDQKASP